MGTTRINVKGLSLSLIQLKHAKQLLKWGYLKIAMVKDPTTGIEIQCFLWQDNNRVLGMIIVNNYFL